jgi:RimJ/RimL family protein N-acetyltransferase
MKERVIDSEITLVPYYPDPETTLPWYQDRDLVKQVDNADEPYTLEKLDRVYNFLNTHGACFYIRYCGELAGDVTLRDNAEICIVVAPAFQNRHIGRRCIADMLALAAEKGFSEVKANIYSFNAQSRRMFAAAGFTEMDPEWFICHVPVSEQSSC